MKKFYGGVFINNKILKEAGIYHPIKLEYYKNINEQEKKNTMDSRFGISVVKTEYINKEIKIEEKEIKYLTNDEIKADYLLNVLKQNYVTPVGLDDILNDFKNFNMY